MKFRRPRPIDIDADLENDWLGEYCDSYGHIIEVIDVKFRSYSIFSKLNGFGLWPPKEVLVSFICREGYRRPENVRTWVRYRLGDGSVVYRVYMEKPCDRFKSTSGTAPWTSNSAER